MTLSECNECNFPSVMTIFFETKEVVECRRHDTNRDIFVIAY
jgi:hypothetical protein